MSLPTGEDFPFYPPTRVKTAPALSPPRGKTSLSVLPHGGMKRFLCPPLVVGGGCISPSFLPGGERRDFSVLLPRGHFNLFPASPRGGKNVFSLSSPTGEEL